MIPYSFSNTPSIIPPSSFSLLCTDLYSSLLPKVPLNFPISLFISFALCYFPLYCSSTYLQDAFYFPGLSGYSRLYTPHI